MALTKQRPSYQHFPRKRETRGLTSFLKAVTSVFILYAHTGNSIEEELADKTAEQILNSRKNIYTNLHNLVGRGNQPQFQLHEVINLAVPKHGDQRGR